MITILNRKWLFFEEEVDKSFEFSEVFASHLRPLDIFFELLCLAEPHLSQEAYRSESESVSNVSMP